MKTNQPNWKLLTNLGDVSPIDYGGYFVYRDTTGIYEAEAELLIAPDSDDNGEGWTVYRFSLDRCQIKEDSDSHMLYLIPASYTAEWPHAVSQYDEWFHKDLAAVADYACMGLAVLRGLLCSQDPLDRAQAYQDIGEYHGFENPDSYPLHFDTRAEVEARYAAELGEVQQ